MLPEQLVVIDWPMTWLPVALKLTGVLELPTVHCCAIAFVPKARHTAISIETKIVLATTRFDLSNNFFVFKIVFWG